MGNESSLYVGAYIEVTLKKMTVEARFNRCENGHPVGWNNGRLRWESDTGKDGFCEECGSPYGIYTEMVTEYPSKLYLIPDEFEDEMQDVTPQCLDKAPQTVLLASNKADDSDWYSYSRWSDDEEPKPFPSEQGIQHMIFSMKQSCGSTIEAIEKNPAVVKIEYKAGFLATSER